MPRVTIGTQKRLTFLSGFRSGPQPAATAPLPCPSPLRLRLDEFTLSSRSRKVSESGLSCRLLRPGQPTPAPGLPISDNSDATLNGLQVLVPMSPADDPDIRRGRAWVAEDKEFANAQSGSLLCGGDHGHWKSWPEGGMARFRPMGSNVSCRARKKPSAEDYSGRVSKPPRFSIDWVWELLRL